MSLKRCCCVSAMRNVELQTEELRLTWVGNRSHFQ